MLVAVRALAALGFVALCSGCATYVAPGYSPDYDSIDRLKTLSLGKVAVGTFQPTNADASINKLSLRGAHLASPNGTFPKYIEAALTRDLTEIGLFAADAATRIEGNVLVNAIDVTGFVNGEGKLDIDITITRAGQQRLRKTYSARITFDSSFAGAVAIPSGQASYPVLVHTFLKKLYADPEFLNAIRN